MSKFEIECHIPSCHITKNMIIQLENYLTQEIANILNIPKEIIYEAYNISIQDKIGIEKLKSINDFPFSMFDNNTTEIILSIMSRNFYLRIAFDKQKKYSNFKIECENANARETALSISKGIERIINAHTNNNKLFYPPDILEFILSITFYGVLLLFIVNLISGDKNNYLSEFLLSPFFLLILAIFFYYSSLSKLLHPYITFDSNKYISLVKYRDWFYKGCLGFIIFGTIFVLIRQYIIGF